MMNTTPNSGKIASIHPPNAGSWKVPIPPKDEIMLDAPIVHNTPNTATAMHTIPPIMDGPLPGLILFILLLLMKQMMDYFVLISSTNF